MYKISKQIIKKIHFNNINLENKKVILRICLNVLDKNGNIKDKRRLNASLVTIKKLIEKKVDIIYILGHAGRPAGKKLPYLSFKNLLQFYNNHFDLDIELFSHKPEKFLVSKRKNEKKRSNHTQIVLIDNTRFNKFEQSKDEKERMILAKQYKQLGDIFINDSFPDYRKAASTYELAKLLPSYIGDALLNELKALEKLQNPKSPYISIFGGVKLSEKLDSLYAILPKVEKVIVGGALSYTIMKAKGLKIGNSFFEEDKLEVAKNIVNKYKDKILTPKDHLVLEKFQYSNNSQDYDLINSENIPDNKIAVDIGPETIHYYKKYINQANTILWNGPMGVFEWKEAEKGTKRIGQIISKTKAFSVVGGGDSLAAISQFELEGFDHVSTGGGALLSYIAYDDFPILDVIIDSWHR